MRSGICRKHNIETKPSKPFTPASPSFIDDYVAAAPLSAIDQANLAETVYCTYLPDLDSYVDHVRHAGFVDIAVEDKTADWSSFVADRLALFRDARVHLEKRYGEATVASLDHFYSTVVDLFVAGNLGGLRLTASLPE